jgi:Family of unknown function (DUF6527)
MEAKIVESEKWFEGERFKNVPGTISFIGEKPSGLGINCPGCGAESFLQFFDNGPGPCWSFDGNKEKPTLTPSVHSVGCCGWHGYLQNGIWVSC